MNKSKKIAMTFDDGPNPICTPMILEVLKQLGISATFFVIGERVEKYQENLKQLVNRGHEIGNHTYSL